MVALADAVGSTSAILNAARSMDAREFIVATDNGMMHKLRTLNPGKTFIEAPTAGNSATCKRLRSLPLDGHEQPGRRRARARDRPQRNPCRPRLIPRARQPIDRMLAFTAAHKAGRDAGALVPNIGAA